MMNCPPHTSGIRPSLLSSSPISELNLVSNPNKETNVPGRIGLLPEGFLSVESCLYEAVSPVRD